MTTILAEQLYNSTLIINAAPGNVYLGYPVRKPYGVIILKDFTTVSLKKKKALLSLSSSFLPFFLTFHPAFHSLLNSVPNRVLGTSACSNV